MQRGRLGFPRQLAQSVNELLLQLVGEVILGAEKDDAALGDFVCVCVCSAVCAYVCVRGREDTIRGGGWLFGLGGKTN